MLIRLIIAVSDTDKATSPLANFVNTLDVTPPGAAAIIMTPRASSNGELNTFMRINAMIGSKISWHINPTIKSLGCLITLKKSCPVNPSPSVSIISANAKGAILVTISKYYPP